MLMLVHFLFVLSLVKLSGTREVDDIETYDKFGRFMVAAETKSAQNRQLRNYQTGAMLLTF